MKLVHLGIISLLFICTPACAKHEFKETEYQRVWCTQENGIIEYRLPDKTRVDCLTEEYAVEFDFANKWAEGIGQTLYYSALTGKKPKLVLILENPKKDEKYLRRAKILGKLHQIKVEKITAESLTKI